MDDTFYDEEEKERGVEEEEKERGLEEEKEEEKEEEDNDIPLQCYRLKQGSNSWIKTGEIISAPIGGWR